VTRERSFHYWRWRFVALWIVFFTVLVALALASSRRNAHSAKTTANELAALVHRNRILALRADQQTRQNTAAIELLCNRAYQIDALALDELGIATLLPASRKRDDILLDLKGIHRQIIQEVTSLASPCAQ
jgi:hypothetical protein